MGRLIDADETIENLIPLLQKFIENPYIQGIIIGNIANQPTAYSIENVVAELEKLAQHNKELSEGAYLEDDKSFYFCAYTNFKRAIGIVRNGGVKNG